MLNENSAREMIATFKNGGTQFFVNDRYGSSKKFISCEYGSGRVIFTNSMKLYSSRKAKRIKEILEEDDSSES